MTFQEVVQSATVAQPTHNHTVIAMWVMVGLATALLVAPVGWALDIAVGLIFPNGPTAAEAEWYGAGRTVVLSAVTAMTGAFGLVVQTVCNSLFYLDTRMRVEGLDLALARCEVPVRASCLCRREAA